MNATDGTAEWYFGYWRSRFFSLWSHIETVPSDPAEAKVLYLRRKGLVFRRVKRVKCGYVHRMECERVDRPNVVYVVDRLAVAFERVLLVLRFRFRIKVLHCYSDLDRCGRIT